MSQSQAKPLESAGIQTIFLVWSKPQGAHRSEFMADILGMDVHNVYFTQGRGLFFAALKYPVQALQTIWLLLRVRPRLVFIQDPPTPAALVVWFCGLFLNIDYIIDIHTQRELLVDYVFLWGMRRFVSKRALTNIVTNQHLADMLREMNAPAIVMEDPPLPIADSVKKVELNGEFTVVWINVAAVDEPRDIIRTVAEQLPHMTFYITGDYERTAELKAFKEQAPENMIFTGYASDEDYYQLLKSVDVAMTLTTWDYTLQQGACEAMWLGRPVITSDWQMLRDYFKQGALFVDNTAESLLTALEEMHRNHARYEDEIKALDSYHRARWQKQVDELMRQIRESVG